MTKEYPLLTSSIRIGNTFFRNRMFAAPMGATDITADCCPGPRTQGFYELRAKGGAAAVTVSELVVHPETDASQMLHLDLRTPGCLAGHTFIADAIRRHGAVPSIEFSHSGQYAGTYLIDTNKKRNLCQYGPSDTIRPDGIPVRALSEAQIADIVRAYGEAAVLAKRAGYEMIMVHCGHSWLINQFLSPFFNHRKDEYGGSFENRIRFAREVLSEVRNQVGSGFPIEMRMSGSELFEGGYDLTEGCRIAEALEDLVDLIHVSAGSYQFGFFRTHLSMFSPHGDNVCLAEEIRRHVSKPVATIGAINDPDQMEAILEEGKADVICMARELMADPYLPRKVEAGKPEEIVKCLRCFTCMAERPVTQTRRCAVNPLIGREMEGMDILPAAKKKTVVVAGGGIAGLEAAYTAARRGHRVILFEKEKETGGILRSEQAIPFKREMYELGRTMELLCRREGVEFRLNTEATPEQVRQEKADALILAVGSNPIVPRIPGIERDNVILVNDLYRNTRKIGEKVAVLGGGLAGCECAVHLNQEGRKVVLVEMRNQLAPDCNIRQRPILMQQLEKGVEVRLETAGISVTDRGLIVRNASGEEKLIEADTVVLAVGQRSNSDAVNRLRHSAEFVRMVGDCIRPANITKAVYEAYHAALDI